jgi:hypothetical protein
VSKDPGVEAIDSELIPYLEGLATDLPVVYIGHGGHGDDPRDTDTVFGTEKAAVRAFGAAMKKPFADLTGGAGVANDPSRGGSADGVVQNRETALKFWGNKVCMALLNNAGIDVNFPFVATAFGDMENRTPHRNQTLYSNLRSSGESLFQANVGNLRFMLIASQPQESKTMTSNRSMTSLSLRTNENMPLARRRLILIPTLTKTDEDGGRSLQRVETYHAQATFDNTVVIAMSKPPKTSTFMGSKTSTLSVGAIAATFLFGIRRRPS